MKELPPIPKQCSDLLLDERGYPIPYFVKWIDGKPDFRILDNVRQVNCIKYKKCGICGKKITGGVYYFISGKLGLKNQICSDPPMHEVCARFSLQICPHMYFEKADRRTDEALEKNTVENPNLVLQKPSVLCLIAASSFYTINDKGYVYIKFKPIRVEYFNYKEGVLAPAEI